MVLFGGAPRLRDALGPAQTQGLLSLVDQDWDLFVESAAHAWLGWSAGETGRLVADGFRTAADPALARAWFAGAAGIDVTDLLPRVHTPTLVLHRQGARQVPVEVSRRLADALPRGTLRTLDGDLPTLFLGDTTGDVDLIVRFRTTGEVPVPAARPDARPDGVTARELDVLRRLATGDSNSEIARALGIAVHTVERHTASLYRKIGARGRADAAAYALRRGLV
jgi:DNA-binding CsgD family transcriptional regulator